MRAKSNSSAMFQLLSLDAHLEHNTSYIRVVINGPILESVVGDLLFHPDDVESVTCKLVLLLHFNKEFAEFQHPLREDPLLHEATMKNFVNNVVFVERWSPTNDRISMLQTF
jgi:hypothetical protein